MRETAMESWRISIHQGLVLIQFDPGTVVTADMLTAITDTLNSEPDKYRSTNVVWDLRNIEPEPNRGFDKLMHVAEHIQAGWQPGWKQRKTAVVADSRVIYGLSRIYAALADHQLDYEVQVFENDLQAALEWAQP
jgi:hypothetical protein